MLQVCIASKIILISTTFLEQSEHIFVSNLPFFQYSLYYKATNIRVELRAYSAFIGFKI